MAIEIREQEIDGVRVLAIKGRLDGTCAGSLEEKWQALFSNGATRLVLDLGELEYLSSAGLRSILQAVKKCAASGARLAACSVQPAVMEIFEISGFLGILKICPDQASALREVA